MDEIPFEQLSAEQSPLIPLSPELIDSALTASEDLYLSLTSQNKIEFSEEGLAIIVAVLRSVKEAYPYSFDAKPTKAPARSRKTKKDQPSDVTRPTE